MDIITHTLSGIAVGTVVISFSKKGWAYKIGILAIAGFGATLPDLDAISLWSGFDGSFGKLFGLEHTGREIYFSKFWYSHHAFMHSIGAALLTALLIGLARYFLAKKQKPKTPRALLTSLLQQKLILIGFILGFIIHLLEDMPTPSCVWGGVNLFWPSGAYAGGTGDIWWWNNYDIILMVCLVIMINLSFLLLPSRKKGDPKKLTAAVLFLGFLLSTIQIKTRGTDFNYTGHTSRYNELEQKSKDIQREILGNRMYRIMETVDNKIPLNF